MPKLRVSNTSPTINILLHSKHYMIQEQNEFIIMAQ